jgi:hypothetical protein
MSLTEFWLQAAPNRNNPIYAEKANNISKISMALEKPKSS